MKKFKKRICYATSAVALALPCAFSAFAADPPVDDVTDAVTMASSIVDTIVTTLKAFLTGVGNSIVTLFDGIVVKNGALTNFATWALVFLGVGLASGVIASVLRKVG